MNVIRQLFSLSFWWSVAWRSALTVGAVALTFGLIIFMGWVFLAHPSL